MLEEEPDLVTAADLVTVVVENEEETLVAARMLASNSAIPYHEQAHCTSRSRVQLPLLAL